MKKILISLMLVVLVGCANTQSLNKGSESELLLSQTQWQGTRVYDEQERDLTDYNMGFIGLALYDEKTNQYEFFDRETKESRNDRGIFFVTNDGQKRVLISQTMKYQAIVTMTKLTKDVFTYERIGKDAEGKDVTVYVEHVPYKETTLEFTQPTKTTGTIDKRSGDAILSQTLWKGTKVIGPNGEDLTSFNQMFISIAKFDELTSKYEFFDINTGESKGDFGYFSVVDQNQYRAHVSIGANKYGAVLKLVTLEKDVFTYERMGKDANGNEVQVKVEHQPYTGPFKPVIGF